MPLLAEYFNVFGERTFHSTLVHQCFNMNMYHHIMQEMLAKLDWCLIQEISERFISIVVCFTGQSTSKQVTQLSLLSGKSCCHNIGNAIEPRDKQSHPHNATLSTPPPPSLTNQANVAIFTQYLNWLKIEVKSASVQTILKDILDIRIPGFSVNKRKMEYKRSISSELTWGRKAKQEPLQKLTHTSGETFLFAFENQTDKDAVCVCVCISQFINRIVHYFFKELIETTVRNSKVNSSNPLQGEKW